MGACFSKALATEDKERAGNERREAKAAGHLGFKGAATATEAPAGRSKKAKQPRAKSAYQVKFARMRCMHAFYQACRMCDQEVWHAAAAVLRQQARGDQSGQSRGGLQDAEHAAGRRLEVCQ